MSTKRISYREFLHKEYEIHHAPYEPEMDFYDAIKNGDTRRVRKLCQESFSEKPGLGTLSKNTLQNLKYHFAISAAMIARVCIEGGLALSESYSMSDYYIQHVDLATSKHDIDELHDEMCLEYAKKMRALLKINICSKPVTECVEYIYENLHTRITVEILSEETGLSPAYLSKLFKKETGVTISDYIRAKKLETAKSMLAYSDYAIADISVALAFPSQSYFNNILKKDCGMTPKQYRDKNHVAIPKSKK